jgi:hypothetical protein
VILALPSCVPNARISCRVLVCRSFPDRTLEELTGDLPLLLVVVVVVVVAFVVAKLLS